MAEVTTGQGAAPSSASDGAAPVGPTMLDVDAPRQARIATTARVHPLAVVGSAAEWREQTTTHPAIVQHDALVNKFAVVDAGVERPTIIGARSKVMTGAYIGHDTILEEDVEVSPGALVSGCCFIGRGARIGIGAVIRPRVTIGANARIGAGAVVVKDVPAGETWVSYPPARRIR